MGLIESIRLAGVEHPDLTFRRTVICLPLLALTAAYVVSAVRKGTTWRALPFFAISYVALGLALDFHLIGIMKRFAPAEPTTGNYVGSYAITTGVVVAVVLVAVNQHRAARARCIPPN
jgi:EamA domain-containing membrane protein RarD